MIVIYYKCAGPRPEQRCCRNEILFLDVVSIMEDHTKCCEPFKCDGSCDQPIRCGRPVQVGSQLQPEDVSGVLNAKEREREKENKPKKKEWSSIMAHYRSRGVPDKEISSAPKI
ncbi:hypothetical protein TNIN_417321 [Trichonephila inaurata madagascariensis]|uniref:Uncharacterized protein n=1 Tax=Trichonephila inaurata madagascariensis TaxID=2747483 RepID=A0A8X7C1C1_9ARAC|nr:hypothetical protein TNIN_417321 [Trichonephila inaurata madagascariensis]